MVTTEVKTGIISVGEMLTEAESMFTLTDSEIKPEAEAVYKRRRKFTFPGDADSDWYAAIKAILYRRYKDSIKTID